MKMYIFDFLKTPHPPPPIWTNSQVSPLFLLESFHNQVRFYFLSSRESPESECTFYITPKKPRICIVPHPHVFHCFLIRIASLCCLLNSLASRTLFGNCGLKIGPIVKCKAEFVDHKMQVDRALTELYICMNGFKYPAIEKFLTMAYLFVFNFFPPLQYRWLKIPIFQILAFIGVWYVLLYCKIHMYLKGRKTYLDRDLNDYFGHF